jgi:teichuronic acid biosynthesis glycosyltransferase TuaC
MFSVMNRALCKRSTERTLDRISPKPDLVYAHFLMSGLLVGDWCRRNQVELAVISGESEYDSFLRWIDRASLVEKIRRFDHLFFVSERNRTALAQYLGLEGEIGRVLANAVDTKTFRPLPKVECRRKLGLPENATIAVFVGYFIERKGPLRVLQALESVDDVYCVFIGKGSQVPKGNRVLFAGSVPNYEMPEWLSAADFFVLPSLNEGRSNAVLEALACGLPLIVSDRDFNREFLDENCAVFIDPNSVGDIANAILELARNPERRAKMGDSGRRHSLNFSQRQRALRFLEVVRGGKIVKKPG